MATRLYAIAPGQDNTTVVEGVGAAASSAAINITIDLASVVNDKGTTRAMKLEEVLLALDNIKMHIMRTNTWPPA